MKPKILVASDSPMIDTGFARVGREIATGLALTGKYDVTYFAWFHRPSDKLLPFKIIPTDQTTKAVAEMDRYGALSLDGVLARVNPDIVLVIGDEWMIKHYAERPRTYKLVAYVPIDGAPIMRQWLDTFRAFDQIVLYGDFAEYVVNTGGGKDIKCVKIPHGVDTATFRPLGDDLRKRCRAIITPDPNKFIIGCVARNNVRKQLPRLLKAFRQFLNPWTACLACGTLTPTDTSACPDCKAVGELLRHGKGKDDALLYLHCVVDDPAGHLIIPLLERFHLNGFVGIPENMAVGRGVPDEQLNQFYNGFDFFTLPTSGEGWGLPILESMSAGCPVLVTDYSAHQQFVHGAGEFIAVNDWDTCTANNMERALVDMTDYVFKMDRFYYEKEDFLNKWGPYMAARNFDSESQVKLECGKTLRESLSEKGRARAIEYEWGPILQAWDTLFTNMLRANFQAHLTAPAKRISVEVL